jgi:peptidoglycan/LPS O-acetylase OafA/YrhL
MTGEQRETFRSVQIARCVAAVIVVLHHSINLTNDFAPDGIGVPAWLNFGFAGVDLFFVISGFIISLVAESFSGTWGSFLTRRAYRIIPFYWFFTFLWIAVSFVGHKDNANGLAGTIASLLVLPQPGFPVLGVGWSLQHEFIFYLLTAALIAVGSVRRLPIVLGCLFAIAIVWHVLLPVTRDGAVWDFKIFSLYHFDFLIGALLYRYRKSIPRGSAWGLIAAGIAMFLGAAALVSSVYDGGHVPTAPEGVRGVVRVLAFGLSSAVLIAGMIALERKHPTAYETPIAKGAEELGSASYALYLMHTILFAVLGVAIGKLGFPRSMAAAVAVAGTVFACLIAVGWYRLVEQPYLDRVTGSRRRRQRLAVDGPA